MTSGRHQQEQQREDEELGQHRQVEREREEERKREEECKREEERKRETLAGQMDRALALLQPQPNKEICPPMMCRLGNRKRKVTWIMCDVCDQWYHVGYVGLTAKKANSLDTWHCSLCV